MYPYNQEQPMQWEMRGFGQRIWGVYGWMASGLLLTAAAAYGILLNVSAFEYIMTHPYSLLLLFGIQLALVVALSFYLMRLSFAAAATCFIVYALLNGIVFSTIFF